MGQDSDHYTLFYFNIKGVVYSFDALKALPHLNDVANVKRP